MFTAPSTCPARFALSSSPDQIHAGIGTLLFDHHNPVGTGFYADAQKWLRASAAQGNDKDEVLLGLFDMRDALLGNDEARVRLGQMRPQSRAIEMGCTCLA